MNEVITIGVDIAKSVFQIHAVDAAGEPVIRRQLRRRQVVPFPADFGHQSLALEILHQGVHRSMRNGKPSSTRLRIWRCPTSALKK